MPVIHGHFILQPADWQFRLASLLAVPPILLSTPLIVGWNVLTSLWQRPQHGLIRHIMVNLLRTLMGLVQLRSVMRKDKLAGVVPPLCIKKWGHLAEVSARVIPKLKQDVPLLSIVQAAGGKVVSEPIPAFMGAPKGTTDVWAKAKEGEKLVFLLVGGGYATGHPFAMKMDWEIVQRLNTRVFSPNYRKSLDDSSAFPASLLDSLAGWQYVVEELGFEPKNILLYGPSAGGHAILCLTRYLDELYQASFTRFGLPGGMNASAPWSDVTMSFPSIKTNKHKDWLYDVTPVIQPSFTRHYSKAMQRNPYLSPALAPADDGHFARLAKAGVTVAVDSGTDEILHDEICALVDNMRNQGLKVDFTKIPGGTHGEYIAESLPFKLWPGMGFSWPILMDAFKGTFSEWFQ